MANRIVYAGRTFDDDQLTDGSCYLACSLPSSALEIDTFDFDVYSTDPALGQFAVDSKVVYYVDDRRVKTFYVQNIKRTGKFIYHFTTVSAPGVLDKTDHYGGIYTGQTVAQVVADICGDFPVSVANNVAKIKLYGWLPIASRRENLAQVLFAISAAFVEDESGIHWVKGLEQTVKRTIGADQTMEEGTVDYGSPTVQVIVLEHQYLKNDNTESEQLFQGTTSEGDRITFRQPMHSLSASGFSIRSSGVNYAVVSGGAGTLTGKPYVHATREVVGKRTATRETTNSGDTVRVKDATLVSLVNARAVADRLADYYAHADRIDVQIDYQADVAGDVVNQWHPYDEKMTQTCLESLDIALSGSLIARTVSLVGYVPPDISQIEYYDTFEILTGSGTWTAPKGAKNGRAVLIGAGNGGQSGTNGKVGEMKPQPACSKSRASKYGLGGEPGKGGQPGTPGKVLQVELDLSSTTSYAYQCGVAGVGGINNGSETPVNGSSGTNTTFGVYNTASGSIPDSGFTNPINQTTYANKGTAGLNGAKGGDGGYFDLDDDNEIYIHGKNGEDVGSAKGGTGGRGYWGSGSTARAGGGGAGAAKGKNGGNGKDHTANGVGGDGASPDKPAKPNYGSAGHGGHGGGGPGGGGGWIADGRPYDPDEIPDGNTPGKVGVGSNGGDAGDGCVFVFYSLPRKEGV